MISWLKRVPSKPFITYLLVLVLLIFLLYSDQRFPLIGENVFGGEEGKDKDRKGDAAAKDNLTTSNTNETSPDRTTPSEKMLLVNNSIQGLVNAVLSPGIFNLKPTRQHSAENTLRKPSKKVLLLASVGRSGSSFLGQLLASQENCIYFYEPIRGMPASERYHDNTDELLRYFNCTIRKTTLKQGPHPNIISVHFPEIRMKNKMASETAAKRCVAEPLVIIKTIRTRLKWVMARMQRNEFDNVKVIHLVRDPRGSCVSIKKLGGWETTEKEICDHVYADLEEKEAMMSLYPNRYIFIKYEDLCLDPYGQARRLLRFIHDQSDKEITSQRAKGQSSRGNVTEAGHEVDWDLPKGVRDFLKVHLHGGSGKGAFTTLRETSSMYQRWRWVITQEQLKVTEDACQNVISALGHTMFRNFSAVRDPSLSLFTNKTGNETHPL